MSRSLYPKQLLALFGDTSLLQQTVSRIVGKPDFAPPVIVANEEHRFIIAEQLREIGVEPAALLLEPVGRNTAPAAAVAALRITESDPDGPGLVMPSAPASGSGCGPTCWPPARQPSNRPKPMPISSASTRRRSPTAQPTPSTMPSWSIRARPRSYRSGWGGAISAPGTRCGR